MPFLRKSTEIDDEGYRQTDLPAGAVAAESLTKIKLGGKTILLTRLQGQLQAFNSACPHAAADLSKGRFTRGQIKCPEHSYTFDIRTGRVVWPTDEVCRLQRFAVKEVGGMIWVQV